MKGLERITELAATLIIEGKATYENAIEMAIKLDNDIIGDVMDAVNDIRSGRVSEGDQSNKYRNGYHIVRKSVINKLY